MSILSRRRTAVADTMPEVPETLPTAEVPDDIKDMDAQIEALAQVKAVALDSEDYARAQEAKVDIERLRRSRSQAYEEWEARRRAAAGMARTPPPAERDEDDGAGRKDAGVPAGDAGDDIPQLERLIAEVQQAKHTAVITEDYAEAERLKAREDELERRRSDLMRIARLKALEEQAREAAERAALEEAAIEERAMMSAALEAGGEEEPQRRGLFGRKARGGGKGRLTYSFKRGEVTTQRVVPFEEMYPDGVARLSDGSWSLAIGFDDANYQSARRTEQLDILTEWAQILNSLDSSVSAQIWLQSVRIGHEEIGEELQLAEVNGDVTGNAFRREINALVRSKVTATERSMRKSRAIVLSTEAGTREKAAKKLATNAERIHRFMNNLDVESAVLTGQQRLDQVNSLCNQDDPAGMATFADLDCSPGLRTLDIVAPSKVVRTGESDLLVGHRLVRSYIVQKYASTTRDDFVSSIMQLPCDTVVTFHARAWEQEQAIGYAEAHLDDVIMENESYKAENTRPERGRFVDDDSLPKHMREAKDEAERIRDGLVNQDQRMFALTVVVTVFGRDREDLRQGCAEVEAVLSEQRLRADWYPEWREAAFSTTLPLGANLLPYTRNMFTDPLAAYIPFTSVEVMDEGGIYLGTNSDTHNFVIFDRETEEAANGFILGMPGGGKSVQSKWTIIQTRLRFPDDDIFVIDPEREYLQLALGLGDSQVINISENSQDHINLFDLSEYYGSEDADKASANPLPLKVNMLQAAFHMMARTISEEEMNIVDAACMGLYEDFLTTFSEDDLPTLQDFYDHLQGMEGPMAADAQHLATLIRRYVTGTFNIFNHRTNVDLDKHLIIFDVQDLGSQLKPLALLVILDNIWCRVTRNRAEGRRTWLFIDELQLLLDDDYAVDYFDMLWTRSRKWGLYCTGITQNITRLLANAKTSYMVENSHFLTLCKQSGNGARLLADFLHLSDTQYRTLRTAAKGEGLYIFGQRKVIHYDNVIPQEVCPSLYRIVTTKFKDIRKYNEMIATGEAS